METKEEELFDKSMNWLHKLAPYKVQYRHSDDCKQSGCPSHTATFTIYHATDGFGMDFGDGQSISLDTTQMALIKDFMNRFNPIE